MEADKLYFRLPPPQLPLMKKNITLYLQLCITYKNILYPLCVVLAYICMYIICSFIKLEETKQIHLCYDLYILYDFFLNNTF